MPGFWAVQNLDMSTMNLKILGNNPEQLYVYHKENNLDHHHVTLEKSSCVMRLIIAVSGSGVHTYHYTDDLLHLHCLHWPLLTGSIIYTGAPLMGPNAPLPWALVHMSRPLGSLHHLVIPTMLFMMTVHKFCIALHICESKSESDSVI